MVVVDDMVMYCCACENTPCGCVDHVYALMETVIALADDDESVTVVAFGKDTLSEGVALHDDDSDPEAPFAAIIRKFDARANDTWAVIAGGTSCQTNHQ